MDDPETQAPKPVRDHKRRLMIPNPKITTLYCLPKIHKPPQIAMKPIASNSNTATKKLAQLMLDIVERSPINHGFSVKNSDDFAGKVVTSTETRRSNCFLRR